MLTSPYAQKEFLFHYYILFDQFLPMLCMVFTELTSHQTESASQNQGLGL
jgi:hypothetical protein